MEYFLGSIITIVVIYFAKFFLSKTIDDYTKLNVDTDYSQSRIFDIVEPFMPVGGGLEDRPVTQMSKYIEQTEIKVLFFENKAYWIKDGTFYVADTNGREVLHNTATGVDTMSMDRVQLDKIMFIVERLTEGK